MTEKVLYIADENRPFYCKKKNHKMYLQVKSEIERFQTEDMIKDCLHSFDTNINESLNILVSKMCPKHKHYGSTPTLKTRLTLVAGVHNMGFQNFYSTLMADLRILDDSTVEALSSNIIRINRTKLQDRERRQTHAFKRQRAHGKRAKTRQEVFEDRIDREHRLGTYKSGIAIEDDEAEDEPPNNNAGTVKPTKQCKWCSDKNHKTWRSKKCRFNENYSEWQKEKNKERKTYLYNNSLEATGIGNTMKDLVCGVVGIGKPPPPVFGHSVEEKNAASMMLQLFEENKKKEDFVANEILEEKFSRI